MELKKRTKIPTKYINNVKDLCKDLFNYSEVPSDEGDLMNRFKDLVQAEIANIKELLVYYEQANCSGKDVVVNGRKVFDEILNIKDTMDFYKKAYELEDDFLDYVEYSADVKKFFKNQNKCFDGVQVNPAKKPPVYKTKKTKNVSIANILYGVKTIETESDIDELLKDIKAKLKQELNEDTIIKLI